MGSTQNRSSNNTASNNIFFAIMLFVFCNIVASCEAHLSSSFYDYSCPDALTAIRTAVRRAVSQEQRMAASLIRLHFHDCFVQVHTYKSSHHLFSFFLLLLACLSFFQDILVSQTLSFSFTRFFPEWDFFREGLKLYQIPSLPSFSCIPLVVTEKKYLFQRNKMLLRKKKAKRSWVGLLYLSDLLAFFPIEIYSVFCFPEQRRVH